MPELKHKDEYDELTDLQQQIVDIRAQNPDFNQPEVAERTDPETSQQSVSRVERNYDHIIQERREEFGISDKEVSDELEDFYNAVEVPGEESDAQGEVLTEIDESPTIQTFQDRPNQNQLTTEQLDYIDNLNASNLEKRVIRAKVKNPDMTASEISEMLNENAGTVTTYVSSNREEIEAVSALPNGDFVEQHDEEDEDGVFSFEFNAGEVVDLLNSNISREKREEIVSELIQS